jgi:hypothetical protein
VVSAICRRYLIACLVASAVCVALTSSDIRQRDPDLWRDPDL